MAIILKEDFINKVIPDFKAKYFPDVIHGTTNNPKYYKSLYYLESFSNGSLGYGSLIIMLSKKTKGRLRDLMKIVDKYIENPEIL